MKLLLNTLLIAGALCVSTGLTGCSDDDNYTPGNVTNSNGLNISFENTANITLSPEETSFKVTLTRNNTTGDMTVPIKAISVTNAFTVPSEVTFKSGESTAEITVDVDKDIEMFTNYKLTLSLAEEYTTPYDSASVADGKTPRAELNVIKEDYEPYATGTVTSNFMGDDDGNPAIETEKTLEYSKIKNLYRIKSFWGSGSGDLLFTWDGKDKVATAESSIPTGISVGSYGEATANFKEASYNEATKTFDFNLEFTVSAGSFGALDELFTITSLK